MKTRTVVLVVLALAFASGLTACAGAKKGEAAGVAASIRAARESRPELAIFPSHVSTVDCRIPRGGPNVLQKLWFDGKCATRLRTWHPPKGIHGGHGTAGTVEVDFTERWRYGSRAWHRSTYVVLVRHGYVLKADTRYTGEVPPQSWF